MLSTRVKAFQKLDTNHDNLLTFEEWAVKTSERFKAVDRDGDGIISRDELNAFYAAQEAAKAQRAAAKAMQCSCSTAPSAEEED
jgi:Ca2+-binding EF-hand superfamily protein